MDVLIDDIVPARLLDLNLGEQPEPDDVENDNSKITLICKPCQSGKTFVMFDCMIDIFQTEEEQPGALQSINIIFTDNSLLQSSQLCSRLDNDNKFSKFTNDDGKLSLILSSTSAVNCWREIPSYFNEGYKNVILCSNSKRVKDICELIKNQQRNYNFNIWIDEADRSYNMFKKNIKIWKTTENVSKITLVTATPKKLLKGIGTIKIIELEKTYDPDLYHRFSESVFIYYEPPDDNYVNNVFHANVDKLTENTVWYIPTRVKKESHYEIMGICIKYDLNCITINSDGIFLYMGGKKMLIDKTDEELSTILAKVYVSKNLSGKPLIITGNLCISRGVTLSSKNMMISHAIFPPKAPNTDSLYQMAGRVCGNFKKHDTWVKPLVFCTEKIHSRVCILEVKSIRLAEKAFTGGVDVVDHNDYKMADSPYVYTQIGPFKTSDIAYSELKKIPVGEWEKPVKKITKRKAWTPKLNGNKKDPYVSTHYHRQDPGKGILTLGDYDKIPKSSSFSKNTRYVVCPVYVKNILQWYARYRIPEKGN
jgi:hypothetical protein